MRYSIIVPVYKVEAYLVQCLESIRRQSYGDFECILVDDGSPDGSGAICDRYAAEDSRFRVIHKPNGGLVSARKAGLAQATGDYVINIDSDDWISTDYLAAAEGILAEHNPDIIWFGVCYSDGKNERIGLEPLPVGYYEREAFEDKILSHILLSSDMNHLNYTLWAKVFRRELLQPWQMACPDVRMGEDVCVSVPVALRCKSAFVSDRVTYYCREHPDSMSRDFRVSLFEDIRVGMNYLRTIPTDTCPDFPSAIDRYGIFMGFVLLITAIRSHGQSHLPEIETAWTAEFREAAARARFCEITSKTRIAYAMLRKGNISLCFHFLKLCDWAKKTMNRS